MSQSSPSDPDDDEPARDVLSPPGNAAGVAMTSIHVRRAVGGDDSSLAWVVQRLSPALVAQARYRLTPRLRRHIDPEDLVNEVWMIALPKLAQFDPEGPRFTPLVVRFLSRTLLHRVNTHLQKRILGKPVEEDPEFELIDSSRTGIVTQAVRDEGSSSVRTAIDDLSETDREVLILRGIEQHSNQEVSVVLGIKPNTVAARYHRALHNLRESLSGSFADELDD